ncbi:MAG: hypothetical protein A2Y88_11215 [Chloroflexi bacterium RBG_13_48_10]|nr:MAG: hypothetical protein A2Y88_11215 [Chloroflexi bacterium RBG_13_48_10]
MPERSTFATSVLCWGSTIWLKYLQYVQVSTRFANIQMELTTLHATADPYRFDQEIIKIIHCHILFNALMKALAKSSHITTALQVIQRRTMA